MVVVCSLSNQSGSPGFTYFRPDRLMVRTRDFQSRSQGSIPCQVTRSNNNRKGISMAEKVVTSINGFYQELEIFRKKLIAAQGTKEVFFDVSEDNLGQFIIYSGLMISDDGEQVVIFEEE